MPIVFSPQFKDLVLEKIPAGGEILTKDLAAFFPDHHIEDTRTALRVLRRFGAADCRKITTKQGPKYLWHRV